jgi:hypothetical protein
MNWAQQQRNCDKPKLLSRFEMNKRLTIGLRTEANLADKIHLLHFGRLFNVVPHAYSGSLFLKGRRLWISMSLLRSVVTEAAVRRNNNKNRIDRRARKRSLSLTLAAERL